MSWARRRGLEPVRIAGFAMLVLLSADVVAQRSGASPPAARAATTSTTPPERFTVQSDGHPMAVWARRPPNPRGAILLVHGLTWSTRPDFDLQVPGLERSVLSSLAARGIAAYGVDLRGYGETPRDATGWLTPRRAAADVINVLGWIAGQHPTLPKPALLGWSRGGAIAQMVAQLAPTRVSAIVLFGFAYDPDAQFVDASTAEKPQMDRNTADGAASDFISPKVTPPAVVKAFVEQALKTDPIRIDLKNDGEFNILKPERVNVPTLVMYGQQDPGIPDDDAGKFFARLGTGDRQLVVLPGGDHAAQLEDTHDMWIAAVVNFLNRPAVKRQADTRRADQAAPETGTFSILGFDQETGEIGGAVQSRVFSVGNGVLWGEAGVGVVATQAIVDVGYGPKAMTLLKQGMAPKDIVRKIWEEDPDPGYGRGRWQKAGRQFAVMNAKGELAAFTGPEAPVEFGDAQGPHSTAQGNTLGSKDVPAAMVKAFEDSAKTADDKKNHLAMRLVLAIEAGQAAGGDRRGQQSSALVVFKKDCGVWLHNDVELRLQVDDNPAPIAELRRLVEKALAPRSGQIPCYIR